MSGSVMPAFCRASAADVGTRVADRVDELAVPRHHRRCAPAHLGAVHDQADASRHRLRIRVVETGNSASIADGRARIARRDTGAEGLEKHGLSWTGADG